MKSAAKMAAATSRLEYDCPDRRKVAIAELKLAGAFDPHTEREWGKLELAGTPIRSQADCRDVESMSGTSRNLH